MRRLPEPLYVTRPVLPPRAEFGAQIDGIYDSGWLTNGGPFAQRLEQQIGEYLGVQHFSYVNNGTQSIQLILRALKITGSVITTPFTYVATANAIALEGNQPIFADVDPQSLCLDPDNLTAALRPDTTAIMPVHVYGRPCEHEAIEYFANKHGLRVIYDAAHAFGCRIDGRSLLSYGDASSVSFHATKPFHSVEGGGIVLAEEQLHSELKYHRSHGHFHDDYQMVAPNAKNSELHAVVGVLNLASFPDAVAQRKKVYEVYLEAFRGTPLRMFDPSDQEGFEYNYAYAAVRFSDETSLLAVKSALEELNVFPRRYFYPNLASLAQFGAPDNCPIAAEAALTSLCLPLFPQLELETARDIAEVALAAISQTAVGVA